MLIFITLCMLAVIKRKFFCEPFKNKRNCISEMEIMLAGRHRMRHAFAQKRRNKSRAREREIKLN